MHNIASYYNKLLLHNNIIIICHIMHNVHIGTGIAILKETLRLGKCSAFNRCSTNQIPNIFEGFCGMVRFYSLH